MRHDEKYCTNKRLTESTRANTTNYSPSTDPELKDTARYAKCIGEMKRQNAMWRYADYASALH